MRSPSLLRMLLGRVRDRARASIVSTPIPEPSAEDLEQLRRRTNARSERALHRSVMLRTGGVLPGERQPPNGSLELVHAIPRTVIPRRVGTHRQRVVRPGLEHRRAAWRVPPISKTL